MPEEVSTEAQVVEIDIPIIGDSEDESLGLPKEASPAESAPSTPKAADPPSAEASGEAEGIRRLAASAQRRDNDQAALIARLSQEIRGLQERLDPDNQEEEYEEEPLADPAENFPVWMDQRLRQEMDPLHDEIASLREQLAEKTQQDQAAQAQTRESEAIGQAVERSVAGARAQHPDYDHAARYLVHKTASSFMIERPDWSQEEAMQAAVNAGQEKIIHLIRSNTDPADWIYRTAQNYGYQPQQSSPQVDNRPNLPPSHSPGIGASSPDLQALVNMVETDPKRLNELVKAGALDNYPVV